MFNRRHHVYATSTPRLIRKPRVERIQRSSEWWTRRGDPPDLHEGVEDEALQTRVDALLGHLGGGLRPGHQPSVDQGHVFQFNSREAQGCFVVNMLVGARRVDVSASLLLRFYPSSELSVQLCPLRQQHSAT